MGLNLSTINQEIKVISRIDSALNSLENYKEYLETLDESLLDFKEGGKPTRFVMRKIIPYGLQQNIKNKMMQMEQGEMQIKLSFMSDEIRASLIDIENPDDIPEDQKLVFITDKDNLVSEHIMSILDQAGVISDLYAARKNAINKTFGNDLKKS